MFTESDLDRLADDGCPWTDSEVPSDEAYNELQGDDEDDVDRWHQLNRFADDGNPYHDED